MEREKYVCCNCGQIFYESDLIPVFYVEGESCIRGQVFKGYKCPVCDSEVNNVRDVCPSCFYYYCEGDQCMYGEPDIPDNMKRECLREV